MTPKARYIAEEDSFFHGFFIHSLIQITHSVIHQGPINTLNIPFLLLGPIVHAVIIIIIVISGVITIIKGYLSYLCCH